MAWATASPIPLLLSGLVVKNGSKIFFRVFLIHAAPGIVNPDYQKLLLAIGVQHVVAGILFIGQLDPQPSASFPHGFDSVCAEVRQYFPDLIRVAFYQITAFNFIENELNVGKPRSFDKLADISNQSGEMKHLVMFIRRSDVRKKLLYHISTSKNGSSYLAKTYFAICLPARAIQA
jgi:hypothetical protein